MKTGLAQDTADQVHGVRRRVYILVVVAVLGAVNFLANRYNKSYDSTANKQFSLSDQTVKVVKNLKQDVKITYFDESSALPAGARPAGPLRQPLAEAEGRLHRSGASKPQMAKAAGFRRDAPILVDSGARKEEAKSLTEEEITGALIRVAEDRRAQRLLRDRQRASTARRFRPHRLLAAEGSAGEEQLQDPHHLAAAAAAKPAAPPAPIGRRPARRGQVRGSQGLHRPGGRRPQVRLHRSPAVDAIKTYVEGGGRALFMLDPPAQDRPRGEPAENPELVEAAGKLGRDAQQGPGARHQRHRPDLRARPGSAAGGQLTSRTPSCAR